MNGRKVELLKLTDSLRALWQTSLQFHLFVLKINIKDNHDVRGISK